MRRVLATLIGGPTSITSVVTTPSTLRLSDRVVSVQMLQNRLHGIQVLEIDQSAIVTPSARDYIRDCEVLVARSPTSDAFKATKSRTVESDRHDVANLQRLMIAGTASWMPSIAKQLCSKQARVCLSSADDSSALRTIADGLRAGHQAGVVIVHSPHAICWQAARDELLRPAVVTNWTELNEVLREVPANVLILSAKTWNVPSACNSARRFYQHLQNRS